MRPFFHAERREARVAECCAERVLRHVFGERARGLQAADAATQLAVLDQRDEAGADLLEPRRRTAFARAPGQLGLDRAASDREQGAPRVIERDLAIVIEPERRVADHAAFVARGITGAACGKELQAEAP